MTIKHLLYNSLLVLLFTDSNAWSSLLLFLPIWVPLCENTLGRCCSIPACFPPPPTPRPLPSFSRQKWSPWLSSHKFQLAIYFQYQPTCVLALPVQWGFLLLELWLIFFTLFCNFTTSENQTVIHEFYTHPTDCWKQRRIGTHSCRTRMKKQSLRYKQKASARLFEYKMHNCSGWHHLKDRRETQFKGNII